MPKALTEDYIYVYGVELYVRLNENDIELETFSFCTGDADKEKAKEIAEEYLKWSFMKNGFTTEEGEKVLPHQIERTSIKEIDNKEQKYKKA